MTSTAAPSAKVHRKSLGRRMAANWQPYVLLLIPVIITIIYKYGPMYGIRCLNVISITLSFTDLRRNCLS